MLSQTVAKANMSEFRLITNPGSSLAPYFRVKGEDKLNQSFALICVVSCISKRRSGSSYPLH